MSDIKESARRYFDDVATVYGVKHGVDLYGCKWGINRYYLPLIRRFIPANSEILEIGCGTGKYTKILERHAKRICAIDISAKMIEVARQRNPNVAFFVADCETLDEFGDEQFDVVAGFNTISYYPDKRRAVSSIHRVLKRDGILFDLDVNGLCPFYSLLSFVDFNEMGQWYPQLRRNSLRRLIPLLGETGFDLLHADTVNWIPNGLPERIVSLLAPMDAVLSRLPMVRKFAMRLIIVGKKVR